MDDADLIVALIARFPELDPVKVAEWVPRLRGAAASQYHKGFKTPTEIEANLCLYAHLITINSGSEQNGGRARRALQSKGAAALSGSYVVDSNTRANASFYNTTVYGQQFIAATEHTAVVGIFA